MALRLEELGDAIARTGASLLALEQDPTLQLLDASALRGETARRWAAAAEARAELFGAHRQLSDLLEKAAAARPAEVGPLLDAATIIGVDVAVPLAERSLLDGSRRVERVTPDQRLADMVATFADVRALVSAVEEIWAAAIPWVRDRRAGLGELTAEALALDVPVPAALADLEGELDAVAESVVADPLAWPTPAVAASEARLDAAGNELASLRAVRDDWAGQLAAARRSVTSLGALVVADGEIGTRARSRISGIDAPANGDPCSELATELDAIAARADTTSWQDAAADLAAWRQRVEAATAAIEQRVAVHQALLDRRTELRGRLDAYVAKAARLHRLEDAELSALRHRAHDALYTAPTDLVEAGELVRDYQDSLRGEPPS
jgi:hypothetical protein